MWCSIYFSCTTASGGDEMKEKQYKRTGLEGKGKREGEGCCWVQGSGGGEEASVPKRRKMKRKEKAKDRI